jgi:hypothetical protein
MMDGVITPRLIGECIHHTRQPSAKVTKLHRAA